MRIVYIGCKSMGYECLKYLLESGKDVVSVYALHDGLREKAAGFRSFDDIMEGRNIPYHKVRDINEQSVINRIKEDMPDMIIQVAWSQIIKDEILKIPPKGAIGFHASLLPKNRGGSPVNWTIINGEKSWGTTMFYMEPGVDSGDIIAQKRFDIAPEDTCKTVYDSVTQKNIEMLEEFLPLLEAGAAPRIKQDESKSTWLKRRKPEDGIIDWNRSVQDLYNWVRALTRPYPGAFSYYEGKKLFVWEAKFTDKQTDIKPGTIISANDSGIEVATADGVIMLTDIELEGNDIINPSHMVKAGKSLGGLG